MYFLQFCEKLKVFFYLYDSLLSPILITLFQSSETLETSLQ